MEEIKAEITRILTEQYDALKNDEQAWRKFIRRLIFKWHPDKNPDSIETATEVTKFIQNEVKRIEQGLSSSDINNCDDFGDDLFNRFWDDLFSRWGSYAQQQQRERENYNRNYSRYHSRHSSGSYEDDDEHTQHHHNYGVPPSFKKNDLTAARKWLDEGQNDLNIAQRNFDQEDFVAAAYFVRMVISIIYEVI